MDRILEILIYTSPLEYVIILALCVFFYFYCWPKLSVMIFMSKHKAMVRNRYKMQKKRFKCGSDG